MKKDSDFPTHHTDSHIEDMFWTDEERAEAESQWGPDFYSAKYHQRLRSLYIEHIPGYAKALHEEIEAQLHYNANKNKKKSDPVAYYTARERLYRARHAMNRLTKQYYTSEPSWGFANSMFDRASLNNDPIKAKLDKEIREAWSAAHPTDAALAKRRSENKETLVAWLKEEIELYQTAIAEPWRVCSGYSSSETVYRNRLKYLEGLQATLDQDGLEAAFTRHTTPYKMDEEVDPTADGYEEVLTSSVLEVGCDDEFVSFDRPTASGSTGYWSHSPTNFRPRLIDPTDTKTIEKAKLAYYESKRRDRLAEDRRRGIIPEEGN